MFWKILALPFRVIGSLLSVAGKTGKWVMTSLLGTIIVATIGFILGMKYVEHRKDPDKRQ